MALKVHLQEDISDQWVEAFITGFKESSKGNKIMVFFEVTSTGESASTTLSNPPLLSEINSLASDMGLDTFESATEVELPETKDIDKQGWDIPVDVFVKRNGQYLNVDKIRPIEKVIPF